MVKAVLHQAAMRANATSVCRSLRVHVDERPVDADREQLVVGDGSDGAHFLLVRKVAAASGWW